MEEKLPNQTPSLPVPRPANDATREKQIPFTPIPQAAGHEGAAPSEAVADQGNSLEVELS